MTANPTEVTFLKGGEFLVKDQNESQIFIPEELNEDQLMMVNMANEVLDKHIVPNLGKLEKLDIELTCELLEKVGETGLLGTCIEEEFGGFPQDFITNMKLTEVGAKARSFALSMGAHMGIGTLPIVYFGNPEQKAKYLPSLATGQLKAAYCLTEPGSGSDALAAKSKAVLSEDGTHYVLNGQKMWITNAGFADIFIVFAKIDGEQFTGFIVHKEYEGVSTAAEEDKMGIKGSSTRQVFFENVKVPVENVLGEIGKGHRIAFNILNIGRIKLGAAVVGGSKLVLEGATQYANDRKQFGKSISEFGAIKHKIGEMATRIYAAESATYRASADIDHKEKSLMAEGADFSSALLGAAEEYSIECALLKVSCSEVLDYCVDEGVQILGGMGYSEEMPMAAAYRDSRINRIFEGTNEINRMLSVDMLMKRALKGKVDLMTPAMAIQKELMSMPSFGEQPDANDPLSRELKMLEGMKKAVLMTAGMTAQTLMQKLQDEQEVLLYISDMMNDIYLAESTLLRTKKLIGMRGAEACEIHISATRVYFDDAIERLTLNAKRAITAWAEGDIRRTLLLGLKRYTKYEPINTKTERRKVADKVITTGEYPFV